MDDGCPIWTPCNISIGTIKLLYWSTAAPNESYTLPTTLYDPTYDFTLYVLETKPSDYDTDLNAALIPPFIWYTMR